MVGHTGVWAAAVSAVEAVDAGIARIADALAAADAADPEGPGALLVITADHGNADEMRDAAGNPVTAHSLNPVPVLVAGRAVVGRSLHDGVLADVTPTILELAGLAGWPGITGRSLLDPV
jgi:2,3-bisphosphoglycerate-independent phosphoglycerate mutase